MIDGSFYSAVMQLITVIVAFVGVLVLAYFITKKIASFKQGSFKNKNMQVMEVLPLGPQQYLYIVRIGESYHLVSSSKDGIRYGAVLEEQLEFEPSSSPSFGDYLEKMRQGKQEKKDEKNT